MNLRSSIAQLAARFEREDNAAHDLWTWLPSYKDAKAKHGDRAYHYQPSTADIMREAAIFLSHNANPTDAQKREAGELYLCPEE